MLIRLTRRLRFRAAGVLAVIYALCVIAPPLALAFADGAVAAHCLTEDHHVTAVAHVHADGTGHVHAKPHDHVSHGHIQPHEYATHDHAMPGFDQKQADMQDTGNSAGGTCCGLFCLNAAVEQVNPSVGIAPRASILRPLLEGPTAGLEPARIDRPPIVLASL